MWQFLLIFSISWPLIRTADVNPCENLAEGQEWVVNPRGCDMYFYCDSEGIARPGRCEPGFHFNQPTQSCELPETVGCTIDDELWVTTCPGMGIAKVPHPYTCSDYSVCLDDSPQDRSCPAGLHFSPYDGDCVDPEIANCKTEQRTCNGTEPFVPAYLTNSRDCQIYYICFNNRMTTLRCGPEQVFNVTLKQCVPVEESDCTLTTPPIIEIPNQLTFDCSTVVNGSRNAHPESSMFWYYCLDGNSHIFWCGNGTKFDDISRTCISSLDCGTEPASIEVNDQVEDEITGDMNVNFKKKLMD